MKRGPASVSSVSGSFSSARARPRQSWPLTLPALTLGLRLGLGLALSLQAGCQDPAPPDGSQPDAGVPDGSPGTLRSKLYPETWQPGLRDEAGRGLPDYSYAGYHNGEAPLPTVDGPLFDVTAAPYSADKTGQSDATAAIQKALTAAGTAGGGVVFFPKGRYRIDGVLDVSKSRVVVRGAGSHGDTVSELWFTASAGLGYKSHFTFHGDLVAGPALPLVTEGAQGSREVRVADASSLKVGDDVQVGWTITDAFTAEHNMTGTWVTFANQWKPFFRRRVVAVDTTQAPHRITLDVPLRYPAKLRDQAAVKKETGALAEIGVESIAVANAVAYADAWKEIQVHLLELRGIKDGWVRDVRSFPSPKSSPAGFHIQGSGLLVKDSKRVTVADTQLEKAQNRGDGGCGYLFEITTSNEILVRDSVGREGRHNFIQNWDFGATGLVFLRIFSEGGRNYLSMDGLSLPAQSEFHHSLTMACLIDGATLNDGWNALNRGSYSSGAGITATQATFWNPRGTGTISSFQFGYGYVVGSQGPTLVTELPNYFSGQGTEPADYVEATDQTVDPPSLYEDQLKRRLARGEKLF